VSISPEYDSEIPYDIATHEANPWPAQPLPVVQANQREAPQFGACMTWPIPVAGTNLSIQILTRRVRRFKAKLDINFTVAGSIILNSNQDHCNQLQGYVITVPVTGLYTFRDWESAQPLYIIATVAGLTVSVLDESYGIR
jgi:hypothetical protein